MNATGSRERANNAKLKKLLAEQMLDIEPLSAIGPRTMARGGEGTSCQKMYGPPRYCKVFVGDAPACVNVSGL